MSMKVKQIVFGGYNGTSTLKIAEAVVKDAHVSNMIPEFRKICEYVLELTEEHKELPDDVRANVDG